MGEKRLPDPFGPLEAIVSIGLALLLCGALLTSVIAAVQLARDGETDISIGSLGTREACARVDATLVPSATEVRDRDVRRGVASVHARELRVCISDPTFWQKAASALVPVGGLIFTVGGLLLIRRVIRSGRRSGPFTLDVASRTRQLGWFMMAMSVVWPFVGAAGAGVVVEAAVRDGEWTSTLMRPDGSLGLVVVSLGILTVARVLRRAVILQEEVDATI